jgi:Skp family chaperone for outer membrane proteins
MNHHAPARTRSLRSPLAAAALIGACIVATAALRSPAEPAPAPPPPQPTSVALVDLEKLMKGLHEMAARNNQNQVQGMKMQDDLTKLNDQAEALKKDLDEGGIIPPGPSERRNEKTAELFQKRALLKATKDSYQAVFDVRRGNIVHEMYDKIIAAIDAFAKREGYDLVLLDDRAIELPPVNAAVANELNPVIEKKRILFARDGMDITDRVMTVMNNQYDATAPAPAPGAGEKPAPAPAPSAPPPGTPKK